MTVEDDRLTDSEHILLFPFGIDDKGFGMKYLVKNGQYSQGRLTVRERRNLLKTQQMSFPFVGEYSFNAPFISLRENDNNIYRVVKEVWVKNDR